MSMIRRLSLAGSGGGGGSLNFPSASKHRGGGSVTLLAPAFNAAALPFTPRGSMAPGSSFTTPRRGGTFDTGRARAGGSTPLCFGEGPTGETATTGGGRAVLGGRQRSGGGTAAADSRGPVTTMSASAVLIGTPSRAAMGSTQGQRRVTVHIVQCMDHQPVSRGTVRDNIAYIALRVTTPPLTLRNCCWSGSLM